MKLYPGGSTRSKEWRALRDRVRERAHDKCENCGIDNHDLGVRLPPDSEFMSVPGYKRGESVEIDGRKFRVIKVVCTTAHRDSKLVDHSLANLAFLCQRCHLALDAPSRIRKAQKTRRSKKPQLDMVDWIEDHAQKD
jgi:hypothetical protein